MNHNFQFLTNQNQTENFTTQIHQPMSSQEQERCYYNPKIPSISIYRQRPTHSSVLIVGSISAHQNPAILPTAGPHHHQRALRSRCRSGTLALAWRPPCCQTPPPKPTAAAAEEVVGLATGSGCPFPSYRRRRGRMRAWSGPASPSPRAAAGGRVRTKRAGTGGVGASAMTEWRPWAWPPREVCGREWKGRGGGAGAWKRRWKMPHPTPPPRPSFRGAVPAG
jgi:hypothetical protein